MQLIDGKATAAAIKAEIAEEVKKIVDAGGKRPILLPSSLDMTEVVRLT